MSEKEKKKTMKEMEELVQQLQTDLGVLTERNANAMQTAQNLANQLNENLGALAQYERTIAVMSRRLSDKDNIIAQLQQQAQQGGEMA
tara:strand:- start:1143 stop:1406 length:264 start_codon:yes stop_codon:yes gene_type:complete